MSTPVFDLGGGAFFACELAGAPSEVNSQVLSLFRALQSSNHKILNFHLGYTSLLIDLKQSENLKELVESIRALSRILSNFASDGRCVKIRVQYEVRIWRKLREA